MSNTVNSLMDYLYEVINLLKTHNNIYEEDLKNICKISYENFISQEKNEIINGLILYCLSLVSPETQIIYDNEDVNFEHKDCCNECEKKELEEIREDDNFNHFHQEEPYEDELLNKLRIFSIDRTRYFMPKEEK